MTAKNRSLAASTLLVFASVLSTTLLIPAVRPFMARTPNGESAAHAFMALSLLGSVVAAPFALKLARRVGDTARLASAVALLDAVALVGIILLPSVEAILALRFVQGGLNLTLLSILLGAARSPESAKAGARYGLLGASMMLAVALGSPLGALFLHFGPRAPLLAACAVELLVALAAPFARLENVGKQDTVVEPRPWLPMCWVFAERAAIGLFVVTFAFHGRQCLGLTDAQVGLRISAFMLPFVVAVHPAGRLSDYLGAAPLAVLGLTFYGLAWFVLRVADATQLLPTLAVLGMASAAVFAAAMREAGAARGVAARIRAMSALNSAGSLGMLFGTAAAGILSAVLRSRGAAPDAAHDVIFSVAAIVQLTTALLTLALAQVLGRVLRFVRS